MIHKISEVKGWSKGTIKIGDVTYVDGTPYISCGICNLPIKKVDAFSGTKHVIISNGRKQVQLQEYKVTVGYWVKEGDTECRDGELVSITKHTPIVHSRISCFLCWNKQQDMIARDKADALKENRPPRFIFYSIREAAERPKKPRSPLSGSSKKYPY